MCFIKKLGDYDDIRKRRCQVPFRKPFTLYIYEDVRLYPKTINFIYIYILKSWGTMIWYDDIRKRRCRVRFRKPLTLYIWRCRVPFRKPFTLYIWRCRVPFRKPFTLYKMSGSIPKTIYFIYIWRCQVISKNH